MGWIPPLWTILVACHLAGVVVVGYPVPVDRGCILQKNSSPHQHTELTRLTDLFGEMLMTESNEKIYYVSICRRIPLNGSTSLAGAVKFNSNGEYVVLGQIDQADIIVNEKTIVLTYIGGDVDTDLDNECRGNRWKTYLTFICDPYAINDTLTLVDEDPDQPEICQIRFEIPTSKTCQRNLSVVVGVPSIFNKFNNLPLIGNNAHINNTQHSYVINGVNKNNLNNYRHDGLVNFKNNLKYTPEESLKIQEINIQKTYPNAFEYVNSSLQNSSHRLFFNESFDNKMYTNYTNLPNQINGLLDMNRHNIYNEDKSINKLNGQNEITRRSENSHQAFSSYKPQLFENRRLIMENDTSKIINNVFEKKNSLPNEIVENLRDTTRKINPFNNNNHPVGVLFNNWSPIKVENGFNKMESEVVQKNKKTQFYMEYGNNNRVNNSHDNNNFSNNNYHDPNNYNSTYRINETIYTGSEIRRELENSTNQTDYWNKEKVSKLHDDYFGRSRNLTNLTNYEIESGRYPSNETRILNEDNNPKDNKTVENFNNTQNIISNLNNTRDMSNSWPKNDHSISSQSYNSTFDNTTFENKIQINSSSEAKNNETPVNNKNYEKCTNQSNCSINTNGFENLNQSNDSLNNNKYIKNSNHSDASIFNNSHDNSNQSNVDVNHDNYNKNLNQSNSSMNNNSYLSPNQSNASVNKNSFENTNQSDTSKINNSYDNSNQSNVDENHDNYNTNSNQSNASVNKNIFENSNQSDTSKINNSYDNSNQSNVDENHDNYNKNSNQSNDSVNKNIFENSNQSDTSKINYSYDNSNQSNVDENHDNYNKNSNQSNASVNKNIFENTNQSDASKINNSYDNSNQSNADENNNSYKQNSNQSNASINNNNYFSPNQSDTSVNKNIFENSNQSDTSKINNSYDNSNQSNVDENHDNYNKNSNQSNASVNKNIFENSNQSDTSKINNSYDNSNQSNVDENHDNYNKNTNQSNVDENNNNYKQNSNQSIASMNNNSNLSPNQSDTSVNKNIFENSNQSDARINNNSYDNSNQSNADENNNYYNKNANQSNASMNNNKYTNSNKSGASIGNNGYDNSNQSNVDVNNYNYNKNSSGSTASINSNKNESNENQSNSNDYNVINNITQPTISKNNNNYQNNSNQSIVDSSNTTSNVDTKDTLKKTKDMVNNTSSIESVTDKNNTTSAFLIPKNKGNNQPTVSDTTLIHGNNSSNQSTNSTPIPTSIQDKIGENTTNQTKLINSINGNNMSNNALVESKIKTNVNQNDATSEQVKSNLNCNNKNCSNSTTNFENGNNKITNEPVADHSTTEEDSNTAKVLSKTESNSENPQKKLDDKSDEQSTYMSFISKIIPKSVTSIIGSVITIPAAYFAIGTGFNRFVLGKSGPGQIPHSEGIKNSFSFINGLLPKKLRFDNSKQSEEVNEKSPLMVKKNIKDTSTANPHSKQDDQYQGQDENDYTKDKNDRTKKEGKHNESFHSLSTDSHSPISKQQKKKKKRQKRSMDSDSDDSDNNTQNGNVEVMQRKNNQPGILSHTEESAPQNIKMFNIDESKTIETKIGIENNKHVTNDGKPHGFHVGLSHGGLNISLGDKNIYFGLSGIKFGEKLDHEKEEDEYIEVDKVGAKIKRPHDEGYTEEEIITEMPNVSTVVPGNQITTTGFSTTEQTEVTTDVSNESNIDKEKKKHVSAEGKPHGFHLDLGQRDLNIGLADKKIDLGLSGIKVGENTEQEEDEFFEVDKYGVKIKRPHDEENTEEDNITEVSTVSTAVPAKQLTTVGLWATEKSTDTTDVSNESNIDIEKKKQGSTGSQPPGFHIALGQRGLNIGLGDKKIDFGLSGIKVGENAEQEEDKDVVKIKRPHDEGKIEEIITSEVSTVSTALLDKRDTATDSSTTDQSEVTTDVSDESNIDKEKKKHVSTEGKPHGFHLGLGQRDSNIGLADKKFDLGLSGIKVSENTEQEEDEFFEVDKYGVKIIRPHHEGKIEEIITSEVSTAVLGKRDITTDSSTTELSEVTTDVSDELKIHKDSKKQGSTGSQPPIFHIGLGQRDLNIGLVDKKIDLGLSGTKVGEHTEQEEDEFFEVDKDGVKIKRPHPEGKIEEEITSQVSTVSTALLDKRDTATDSSTTELSEVTTDVSDELKIHKDSKKQGSTGSQPPIFHIGLGHGVLNIGLIDKKIDLGLSGIKLVENTKQKEDDFMVVDKDRVKYKRPHHEENTEEESITEVSTVSSTVPDKQITTAGYLPTEKAEDIIYMSSEDEVKVICYETDNPVNNKGVNAISHEVDNDNSRFRMLDETESLESSESISERKTKRKKLSLPNLKLFKRSKSYLKESTAATEHSSASGSKSVSPGELKTSFTFKSLGKFRSKSTVKYPHYDYSKELLTGFIEHERAAAQTPEVDLNSSDERSNQKSDKKEIEENDKP